jgi:hypothetical protein
VTERIVRGPSLSRDMPREQVESLIRHLTANSLIHGWMSIVISKSNVPDILNADLLTSNLTTQQVAEATQVVGSRVMIMSGNVVPQWRARHAIELMQAAEWIVDHLRACSPRQPYAFDVSREVAVMTVADALLKKEKA